MPVLVNGLPFVVVFGRGAAERPGDGLRGFVRLEPLVERALAQRLFAVARALMGQHQIVVGGDVLGVYRQHRLVGGDGRVVLPVEELQAPDLAEDDAVARILLARRLQVPQRLVVAAEGAQRGAEEEVGAGEAGF